MKKSFAAAAGALLMACSGLPTEAPREDRITALEQACLADPLDPAGWEQLAAALAMEGERERAGTMYLQAASLRRHDVQQDHAILKRARDEAIVDMPRTQVRRISSALVEVLRIPAAGVAAAGPAPAPWPDQTLVRLEISNGNGVTGAAARLARSLEVDGLKTVRLSNARPFVEPNSRIEYQRGQKQIAQALGRRLNMPLQPLRGNPAYADMRIVLGHDSRYLK